MTGTTSPRPPAVTRRLWHDDERGFPSVALVLSALLILFGLNGAPLPALATELTFGDPEISGPGCPQGRVSATMTPDRRGVSILFDRFVVDIDGFAAVFGNAVECEIRLPLRGATANQSVRLDYRVSHATASSGRGGFTRDYSIVLGDGARPIDRQHVYRFRAATGNALLSDTVAVMEQGADAQQRSTLVIALKIDARDWRGRQCLLTMDSVDIVGSL